VWVAPRRPSRRCCGSSAPSPVERIHSEGLGIHSKRLRIQSSQHSVKKTQDSVRKTQDSVKRSQDSVKKTQDSVKQTEDSVRKTEDSVRKTQDLVKKMSSGALVSKQRTRSRRACRVGGEKVGAGGLPASNVCQALEGGLRVSLQGGDAGPGERRI